MTEPKKPRRCPTCGMPSLADELDKLRAELDEIRGALRNFKANGSDAVKQIQGIYADLEIATNDMRDARTREKKLAPAIAAAVKQLDRTVGLDLPTPVTEAARILRAALAAARDSGDAPPEREVQKVPPMPVVHPYFPAKCPDCGWRGSSEQCADDRESYYCPQCGCDCAEDTEEN